MPSTSKPRVGRLPQKKHNNFSICTPVYNWLGWNGNQCHEMWRNPKDSKSTAILLLRPYLILELHQGQPLKSQYDKMKLESNWQGAPSNGRNEFKIVWYSNNTWTVESACYLILSIPPHLLTQPPANTVAVVTTAQPRREYNLSLRVIGIASIICHYQSITLTVVFPSHWYPRRWWRLRDPVYQSSCENTTALSSVNMWAKCKGAEDRWSNGMSIERPRSLPAASRALSGLGEGHGQCSNFFRNTGH